MGYKRISLKNISNEINISEQKNNDLLKKVYSIEIGTDDNITIENKSPAAKKISSIKKSKLLKRMSLFLISIGIILSVFVAPIPTPIENFLIFTTKILVGENFSPSETAKNTTMEKANISNMLLPFGLGIPENIPQSDKNVFQKEDTQKKSYDLSKNNLSYLYNETQYNVNIENILSEKYPIDSVSKFKNQDDAVAVFAQHTPQVLLIHTHGTECYADAGSENFRTTDTSKNVVRVGKAIYDKLTENGISTIHCTSMFDEKSYINSYSNSYAAVKDYLEKNPSIKYVIDIHRDAISDTDGTYKRLICQNGSDIAAQMMFVIGTNEAGAKHNLWKSNLRTAVGLQYAISNENPSLMRPINLRRASFNQQLCKGYFILEVGNCGNTLSEAITAAEIFADIFSKTV